MVISSIGRLILNSPNSIKLPFEILVLFMIILLCSSRANMKLLIPLLWKVELKPSGYHETSNLLFLMSWFDNEKVEFEIKDSFGVKEFSLICSKASRSERVLLSFSSLMESVISICLLERSV